jgi:hypothetical protein
MGFHNRLASLGATKTVFGAAFSPKGDQLQTTDTVIAVLQTARQRKQPKKIDDARLRDEDHKEVAMKMLTAIVIAALMLIGALPATAGQSTFAPEPAASAPPVRLAAGGDTASDRETYTQKAWDDVQEWQRKLRDVSAKAEADGKETGNKGETDLNKAWTKTEAASRKLQTVGAEGWGQAKTSFERASRELADAWDKIRSHKLRSQDQ